LIPTYNFFKKSVFPFKFLLDPPTDKVEEEILNRRGIKMGAINNILGLPPGLHKTDKNKEPARVGKDSGESGKAKKTEGNSPSVYDKAVISNEARELLSIKAEAVRHTDRVKNAETISPLEIEAIKQKIAADFYFEPEVIDKVVDKLIALPNYK